MMNRRASFVLMLLMPLRLGDGQQKNKLPQCPDPPKRYWDNCTGTRTFPNGNVYVGEFHNNTFNGQGYLRYSHGNTYNGEFRDSQITGQGTYTFANGTKLVGEFKDGKFIGSSTFEVRLGKQRGVLVVPVLINDKIPLDFVVDSGPPASRCHPM